MGQTTPHDACPTTDLLPPAEQSQAEGRPCQQTNGVSRDDASMEVTTPIGAAVACPEPRPGFHSKMAPSVGRATPEGAAPLHRTNPVSAFAQSMEPPLLPFVAASRQPCYGHNHQGDAPVAAPPTSRRSTVGRPGPGHGRPAPPPCRRRRPLASYDHVTQISPWGGQIWS
jgi:hypothetical protein